MTYIRPDNNKPSQMMLDAGMGGAGPYVHCSCGKDHYVPKDEDHDWDSDCDPEDMFYYINLNGMQFVVGCSGCEERLAKYENFIWQERDLIRRYLKIRIDQEKDWADQEHLKNIIAGITSE